MKIFKVGSLALEHCILCVGEKAMTYPDFVVWVWGQPRDSKILYCTNYHKASGKHALDLHCLFESFSDIYKTDWLTDRYPLMHACVVYHHYLNVRPIRELKRIWGKIEESEKAGNCQESNPGHLACAASALPLSHDSQTTTSPHNPLLCMFRPLCSTSSYVENFQSELLQNLSLHAWSDQVPCRLTWPPSPLHWSSTSCWGRYNI